MIFFHTLRTKWSLKQKHSCFKLSKEQKLFLRNKGIKNFQILKNSHPLWNPPSESNELRQSPSNASKEPIPSTVVIDHARDLIIREPTSINPLRHAAPAFFPLKHLKLFSKINWTNPVGRVDKHNLDSRAYRSGPLCVEPQMSLAASLWSVVREVAAILRGIFKVYTLAGPNRTRRALIFTVCRLLNLLSNNLNKLHAYYSENEIRTFSLEAALVAMRLVFI